MHYENAAGEVVCIFNRRYCFIDTIISLENYFRWYFGVLNQSEFVLISTVYKTFLIHFAIFFFKVNSDS